VPVPVPILPGSWSDGPDLPEARSGACAVTLGDAIYIIGGSVGGTALDSLLEFDPVSGNYTARASMNTARYNFAACGWGGKIYVFGGCSNETPLILEAAEVYDPGTDTWMPIAGQLLPRYEHVAGVCNGKIWINGGGTYGGMTESTTWCYDPAGDTWTGKYPSPYMDMPTSRRNTCGAALNGCLLVACGVKKIAYLPPYIGYESVTAGTLEAYDSQSDTWQTCPDAPTARFSCACAALDGRLFVISGGNDDGC
jgi:N-acetylneuraminic acid mutarotase